MPWRFSRAGQCGKWEQQLPRPRLHRACVTGLEGAVRVGCGFADIALNTAEETVAATKMEMVRGGAVWCGRLAN